MTVVLCKAEDCKYNKDKACTRMIVNMQFMRTDNPCCYDFDDYEPPVDDDLDDIQYGDEDWEIDPDMGCH